MNQLRDFTSLVLVLFVRNLHMIDLSPPPKKHQAIKQFDMQCFRYFRSFGFTKSPIYQKKRHALKRFSFSRFFSPALRGKPGEQLRRKGSKPTGPCGGKTHDCSKPFRRGMGLPGKGMSPSWESWELFFWGESGQFFDRNHW